MPNKPPFYLFADSQIFFWRPDGPDGPYYTECLKEHLPKQRNIKAAYIGASNGDEKAFYDIFVGAMSNIGVLGCRMIKSTFSELDEAFLRYADLILLAGGDAAMGWKTIKDKGMDAIIRERVEAGAMLIGVSAGAAQMGMRVVDGELQKKRRAKNLLGTLTLLPCCIATHGEKDDWEHLKVTTRADEGYPKGVGIPSGGGLIYYSDLSFQAIRHPLQEIIYSADDDRHTCTLIMPDVP